MMLPEDIPIVVPDCDPDHMWEVDLWLSSTTFWAEGGK